MSDTTFCYDTDDVYLRNKRYTRFFYNGNLEIDIFLAFWSILEWFFFILEQVKPELQNGEFAGKEYKYSLKIEYFRNLETENPDKEYFSYYHKKK